MNVLFLGDLKSFRMINRVNLLYWSATEPLKQAANQKKDQIWLDRWLPVCRDEWDHQLSIWKDTLKKKVTVPLSDSLLWVFHSNSLSWMFTTHKSVTDFFQSSFLPAGLLSLSANCVDWTGVVIYESRVAGQRLFQEESDLNIYK